MTKTRGKIVVSLGVVLALWGFSLSSIYKNARTKKHNTDSIKIEGEIKNAGASENVKKMTGNFDEQSISKFKRTLEKSGQTKLVNSMNSYQASLRKFDQTQFEIQTLKLKIENKVLSLNGKSADSELVELFKSEDKLLKRQQQEYLKLTDYAKEVGRLSKSYSDSIISNYASSGDSR